MELNVSIQDAGKLCGKSIYFIRNAIAKGRLPGTLIGEEGKRRTFNIPKNAILAYVHMTEEEADIILAQKKTPNLQESVLVDKSQNLSTKL